jgi:AraC-like DNA-binding protein
VEKLYNNDKYHEMIKRILMINLHNFSLIIDMMAKRLNMSVRKLLKILQDKNTSIQLICNNVKKEIALLYLFKENKIKEITQKPD